MTHNWNISRSDLLPIILNELDLNDKLSEEEKADLDAIVTLFHEKARALGGRMKQLFVSSEDLDNYVYLSDRNGYEIESIYKDTQGQIKPTTDPSKALIFYRSNPTEFIQEHRKHFDKVVRPRLGDNIRNAVYEGDFSKQNDFITRDNDKHHLCQLQFRVYLHPELMFNKNIKIYDYISKNASEKEISDYKKSLSKVTKKLVSLWIKHHPELSEEKYSKHLPKEISLCADCKKDFKEIYPDYDKEEEIINDSVQLIELIEEVKNEKEELPIEKLNLESSAVNDFISELEKCNITKSIDGFVSLLEDSALKLKQLFNKTLDDKQKNYLLEYIEKFVPEKALSKRLSQTYNDYDLLKIVNNITGNFPYIKKIIVHDTFNQLNL